MKILFIAPGSGDSFYCGNCFRDNLQANALRKAGHEVTVMPLYLPLGDASFRGDTPLFFPAVSVYVSQKLFRRKGVPGWLRRWLDGGWALRRAAAAGGSTSAAGLEGMTLSMINGTDAVFLQHVAGLVAWVQAHARPDVVHLSSSLVIGVARSVKRATGLPVVCSLQDEGVWIDALGRHAEAAWRGIEANLGCVDGFVASSHFYRSAMERRLPLAGRIEVIYPGPDGSKYASESYPERPTIGFFYRMNQPDGLDILAEAFVKVKQSGRVPRLRLRIGGGCSGADRGFVRRVRRMLRAYAHEVDWVEAYSVGDHAAFYRETTAVCVPVTFDEGVGLYVCEACAAGRPVVEPATGSFPEIVAGAGVLYPENNSDRLAEAIIRLFTTEGLWEACRQEALLLAHTRYNDAVQAEKLVSLYARVIQNPISLLN
jgi:glycosyltransferase involved in cell wall biosynthesis